MGDVNKTFATLKKRSRYGDALESSPHLLAQLQEAAQESLSLRDEVAAARLIVGETLRMLGRSTSINDGVMPQAVAQLALAQMREVNSLIASCAAIEAKRQDQQLDAAKVVLLIARLKQDMSMRLKEAGMPEAVLFVDAAFREAEWTGALDEAAVSQALQAPASFDVKFRPIERDSTGKLLEGATAYDTPEEALTGADLDLTARSAKLATTRADSRTPLAKAEDDALATELEAANAMLDKEIVAAAEEGAPLPGVPESRQPTKLDRAARKLLEERG